MSQIIVPTDFSVTSVNAAFYAAEIARRVHADLLLLHAVALPLPISEVPIPAESYEYPVTEANRLLQELIQKLEAMPGEPLSITCKATIDSFTSEIDRLNKQNDIFAFVMGTSGAGATEAFFLGSFSLIAARHLRHPLIVVPPGYRFQGIRKIGLACDMHNIKETLPVPAIKTLFGYFDAKLEILYVSRPDGKMYPEVLTESRSIQNRLACLHPEINIGTNEDIEEGLEDFVSKRGLDLLILLPKERNFVERILHKSLTKKMVLHTGIPVIILH